MPLPSGFSLLSAMSLGTAGLTAGACVKKILNNNPSFKNPVLVSGATGGVGSVAVNLLSNLNFEVHAITGKSNEQSILKKMGALKVIDRNEFIAEIFVKPARSINFITLQFIATRTGVSFDEVAG